jgi:hypothetical protein
MRYLIPALLLIVATPAPCARAADVALVKDGRANCVIVVAPDLMAPDAKPAPAKVVAAEAEHNRVRLRESARDLAACLEKMSGAKIEILTGDPPAGDPRVPIYVAARAEKVFGPPARSARYKQGFRYVVSATKGVGLLGESDLAASYAVYELLDRLGCRWYLPGDLGECLPTLPTIALAETDFSSAPSTLYRGVWFGDDAFRRRNRHGGLQLSAGHALEMYLTKDDRQKHPEWVGEFKGKPSATRLKWSSETLADAIARKILDRHAKDPRPSYSLSPDDGLGWDDSPADRALDAGDVDPGFGEVSKTDRLMVLCNRIAAKVAAQQPDVLLGVLAYVDYTRPPVREKPHPNLVPQIAPITYSRAHPMTDDAVPGNKDLRYLIEGWGKRARMTSAYFYGWFLAEPTAPNPLITKWGVDVPIVLSNNCQLWQPETHATFESTMHGLYLGCRLAWNSSLKPADIVDELHAKFYGAAAKEMAAYWHFIDGVWVKTPEYSGCGFAYLRRWTPERMAEARRLLDAGIAAAKSPAEQARVQLADDSLKLFELFMKLRVDQAEGRFAGLADGGREWMARIVALGEKYKANYCFTRASYSKRTMGGDYFASFYQKTYEDAARIAKDFRVLTTPPIRSFRYRFDPDKSGESAGFARPDFDDAAWKTTDVCTETWSTLGHHDDFKSAWYRATVDVPAAAPGGRTRLWIGATDGSVKVFVNGQHVPYVDPKGKAADYAEGYCEPFSFDITPALKPNQKNAIALLCTRTAFNELGTGGLIAPVVLYSDAK